ncbi:hypothetical protein D910_02294 [Dendroctonus ponderosae]|uniref:JNK1/MAPK8-associated membrane protein n=1 Tax=Dendroctonus ponderosae TaxID=77166 RepID=U4U2R4_DENPD|nr:hypothetical protein D910_02294 [Dendroctonus ponderosae]
MLILHWFFIDMVSMRRSFSKNVLVLHASAFFEVLISCLLAVLSLSPIGEFTIYSCHSKSLSDWYTLLHNPTPDYGDKVYCTQEAVYPLYTIVFLFYVLSLVSMLLVRPWLCRRYLPRQGKMAIYAAMYFIPILILIHAVIGGLVYYSFPYLLLVISVISCAAHFAVRMEQNIPALIRSTITQPRNIVIVLGHWCLHAYGIISLTQLDKPLMHGLLLLLVPLPALFYIFTVHTPPLPPCEMLSLRPTTLVLLQFIICIRSRDALQKTVFKKTKDDSGNYVFTYIFEHNVTSGGLRRHLSRYQGPGRRGRRPLVPRSPTTDAGGKTLMETEDCRTENFFLYE